MNNEFIGNSKFPIQIKCFEIFNLYSAFAKIYVT